MVVAFPGAEGFGAVSVGGRGGSVIEVTNLNDSGAGSFRAACDASGARTVVFRTGGTITLNTSITISNPFITIAGQSAPGGGICLRNGSSHNDTTLFVATHDVIIRYLRVRPGNLAGLNVDGLQGIQVGVTGTVTYNVILDHCSISWGTDGNLQNGAAAHDVTYQWCLLSEGLNDAGHTKGKHSRALNLYYGNNASERDNSYNISIHHNLMSHVQFRVPQVSLYHGKVEVVNNVVYHTTQMAMNADPIAHSESQAEIDAADSKTRWIKNYCARTSSQRNEIAMNTNSPDACQIYAYGNIGPARPNDTLPQANSIEPTMQDHWIGDPTIFPYPTTQITEDATAFVTRDRLSETGAYAGVQSVGATLPVRDSVDTRQISYFQNYLSGTGQKEPVPGGANGGLLDNQSQVGGYPTLAAGTAPTDTDHDGMPDAWETAHGLNPNSATDRNNIAASGYTYLEEYLNSLVSDEDTTPVTVVVPVILSTSQLYSPRVSRPGLTPFFACGAECGVLGAGAAPGTGGLRHWNTVTGAPTIDTVTFRPPGIRSYRFTTVTGTAQAILRSLTTTPVSVFRAYIRFDTSLPTANCALFRTQANGGSGGVVFFKASDSKLYTALGAALTNTGATGISVTPGVWYRVEYRFSPSVSPRTMELMVNGVSAGTASTVEAVSTCMNFDCGGNIVTTTANFTLNIDDIVQGSTSGDYPFGQGGIKGLFPSADGTHVYDAAGDFKYENTTNVATGATDTYTHIDDTLDNITDFISVNTASATEYLEWQFQDLPTAVTSITGVEVVMANHSSGTAANKLTLRLNDGGTLSDVWTDLDQSQTTIIVVSKQYPTSPSLSGPWTKALVDGLTVRANSSYGTPDVADVPFIDGICLEVDFTASQDISVPLLLSTSILRSFSVNQVIKPPSISSNSVLYPPARNLAAPLLPTTFTVPYQLPTGGTTWTVHAGDNLQTVIDSAALGDVIVIDAGATFTGNYKLPVKTGSGWLYIISSSMANLPPEHYRVAPSDAADMPCIQATQGNTLAALNFYKNAHHYRFAGIEIKANTTSVSGLYNLIQTGYGKGALYSDSLSSWQVVDNDAEMPHHIVFDRCYVHSLNVYPKFTRCGYLMNGHYMAVVDSYFKNFTDSSDAQAINIFQGTGPYKIVNNYLEATGENFMIGGSDPRITNANAEDVEFVNNYLYKDQAAWSPNWTIKNLFELKNGRRVLCQGNVMERCYADMQGQGATAIVLTVRNQENTNPNAQLQDITIRYNRIKKIGKFFRLTGYDNFNPTLQTQRVLIEHNGVDELTAGFSGSASGPYLSSVTGPILDCTVRHNLEIFNDTSKSEMCMFLDAPASVLAVQNLSWVDNITCHGDYGIYGNGVGSGFPALTRYVDTYTLTKNIFIDRAVDTFHAATYPAGNVRVSGSGAVGFTDYSGRNYTLTSSSTYKNWGTDGTDPGPDWATLNSEEAKALTGTPGSETIDPPASVARVVFGYSPQRTN